MPPTGPETSYQLGTLDLSKRLSTRSYLGVATPLIEDHIFRAELRYSTDKMVWELRGKDLIHLHQNDWVVRDVTMEYISTSLYRQMPGHIMLSVRYTI